MERYANLGGHSGIKAYEAGEGCIRVRFSNGSVYLYTDASAGAHNITQMKRLARRGRGLATFISTTVHDRYARRER